MIRTIKDRDGNILEERQTAASQAMRPETAYALRSMMQDAVRAGTGKPAAIKNINVFGKTGTSNDFMDAWFCGGVPGLTTAVYVGRDDHKSMGKRAFGGTLAAPVWRKFMQYAVQEMNTPANFAPPPSWVEVDKISICRASGYRALKGCQAVPLFFPKGKAPTASCPIHGGSSRSANNDPRGPRLFLVEQDDTYFANLQRKEREAAAKAKKDAQRQEEAAAQQQVTAQAQQASIPRPNPPAPRRQEPKVNEVEQRYQQLLKQYGLN